LKGARVVRGSEYHGYDSVEKKFKGRKNEGKIKSHGVQVSVDRMGGKDTYGIGLPDSQTQQLKKKDPGVVARHKQWGLHADPIWRYKI